VKRWRVAISIAALFLVVAAGIFACSGNWCTTIGSKSLCDDFDNNSAGVTQEGLAQQSALGDAGGAFVLNADAAYTAPNCALGTANPFEGGTPSGVQLLGALWQGAQPPPPLLTCALQVQPQQLSSTPNDVAVIMALAIGSASGASAAQLSIAVDTQGNIVFREDYPTLEVQSLEGLPAAGGMDGGLSDGSSDAAQPEGSGPPDAVSDATFSDGLPSDAMLSDGTPSDAALQDVANDAVAPNPAHGLSAQLSYGYWTQIQMQFTQSGASSTGFTVTVESQAGVGSQGSAGTLLQSFPSPMTATLMVGPTDISGASSGWAFFYDNVVCY
jgi:hypothetical protein